MAKQNYKNPTNKFVVNIVHSYKFTNEIRLIVSWILVINNAWIGEKLEGARKWVKKFVPTYLNIYIIYYCLGYN